MVIKRGRRWYIYFRPFRDEKVGLVVNVQTKSEARLVESALILACRGGYYGGLDIAAREACIRMFINHKWQLPPELGGGFPSRPVDVLTLWKSCELFMKYPEIAAKDEKALSSYRNSMANFVARLGKDTPLKSLWVPELKRYQVERLNEGVTPSTVNTELSCLSRVFAVMVEMQLVETNPCRLLKRLSTKSNEREVYLSMETVQAIAAECPEWYQRFIWIAFYTGMRRGEILALTRKHVNLSKRIISLRPEETKEGKPKRVPVHRDLVPILEECLRVPYLKSDRVILTQDNMGIREPSENTIEKMWPRACTAIGLDPIPRSNDLRHTWRTNARRSGVDYQVAESIMGHWHRAKSVNDRYGRISDAELLRAIDMVTFSHGETEIVLNTQPRKSKEASPKKGNKTATNDRMRRGSRRIVGA